MVVQKSGGESEQPLADACDNSSECPGAVTLERELALERLKRQFDPLTHRSERAKPRRFITSIRPHQETAERADELLELGSREALVGDHELAWLKRAGTTSAPASRSGVLAGTSSNAIGIPSPAQSSISRKPQK